MPSSLLRRVLPAALLLIALLLPAACKPPTRTYEVRGRVVGFGDDGRTVIVEHEDVQGLMPAMTMPFTSAAPGVVDSLALGDAIRFQFTLGLDSTWIHGIERLPDDALPRSPAGGSATLDAPEGTPILQPGDTVPSFELVAQDGEPIGLADFRDQALLVTFIYTRCPIPDFCPLMTQNFKVLHDALTDRFGSRVHLLSITFDPAYDTPEVLRQYAARYTADTSRWTFATGTPEQVGYVAHLFGVFYEKADGQEINHTLSTTLVGPDGRVRRIWRGNDWTTDEVARAVEQALADASRPAS